MIQPKINYNEIKIELLDRKYNFNDFTSYEPDLVDFLKEDALQNQKQMLSVTFLWFFNDKLVSYITLLNDKINLEGDLKHFFSGKGVYYKSLPSLKVGRLCVDDRFLRRGLGKLMMIFAREKAREINKDKAGCRFITVDSKIDSIPFYLKLGFKPLQVGSTAMYLDLLTP